ncbi:Ferroporti-1 [Sparassis latifolia]
MEGQSIKEVQVVPTVLDAPPVSSPSDGHSTRKLDRKALALLLVQHLSNSWGLRTAEFAIYLFLITLFPDSLLPASIYGFLTTGTAILLSGWAGHQVDIRHNLRLVRVCTLTLKVMACSAYAAALVLMYHSRNLQHPWSSSLARGMFSIIIICGCIHNLAGVAISVAIERDWVTVIADGSSEHLTTINTYMRRIDLLCKLLAPLFVSLLTTAASYPFAAYFLCGIEALCMVFELIWITIVYRRFPQLQAAQAAKEASGVHAAQSSAASSSLKTQVMTYIRDSVSDWKVFTHHPIFMSSVAISCLYFTVLSFDGTMLSYLKAETYSDPFVAGMRALNVAAGLAGTLAMPLLERKLGLVRAGNWSIWSEAICLVPVLISFYVGAPPPGHRAPAWNAALLFGGMMLSRIGLWAFDLCQLKELQIALATHPRRNAITALQYSLQNIADMLKYLLTMILSRPSQFKIAALTSFVSVVVGASTYLAYVRKERGHILHHDFADIIPLLKRTTG